MAFSLRQSLPVGPRPGADQSSFLGLGLGSCSKLELGALLFPRRVVERFIVRLASICIAKSFQQAVCAPDLYCFRVDPQALGHLCYGQHTCLAPTVISRAQGVAHLVMKFDCDRPENQADYEIGARTMTGYYDEPFYDDAASPEIQRVTAAELERIAASARGESDGEVARS